MQSIFRSASVWIHTSVVIQSRLLLWWDFSEIYLAEQVRETNHTGHCLQGPAEISAGTAPLQDFDSVLNYSLLSSVYDHPYYRLLSRTTAQRTTATIRMGNTDTLAGSELVTHESTVMTRLLSSECLQKNTYYTQTSNPGETQPNPLVEGTQ